MPTIFLDAPLSEYIFHRQTIVVEDGYHYYLYIHPRGQVVIMRAKEDESEYLYADGQLNQVTSWNNRANLDYKYYDQLA